MKTIYIFDPDNNRVLFRKINLPANFTSFPRSSCLLSCIKQLLPALHAGHGLHILAPVSHFFSLPEEKKCFVFVF